MNLLLAPQPADAPHGYTVQTVGFGSSSSSSPVPIQARVATGAAHLARYRGVGQRGVVWSPRARPPPPPPPPVRIDAPPQPVPLPAGYFATRRIGQRRSYLSATPSVHASVPPATATRDATRRRAAPDAPRPSSALAAPIVYDVARPTRPRPSSAGALGHRKGRAPPTAQPMQAAEEQEQQQHRRQQQSQLRYRQLHGPDPAVDSEGRGVSDAQIDTMDVDELRALAKQQQRGQGAGSAHGPEWSGPLTAPNNPSNTPSPTARRDEARPAAMRVAVGPRLSGSGRSEPRLEPYLHMLRLGMSMEEVLKTL